MLGDVSWTGWSSIKNVDIIALWAAGLAGRLQVLEADFQDTYRVALGATTAYSDTLKFMFGLAYDQTPVKKASTRLTSLPDNDRTWFTFGAQWKPAREQTLELGAAVPVHPQDQDQPGRDQLESAHESWVGNWRLQLKRLDSRRPVLAGLLVAPGNSSKKPRIPGLFFGQHR
jgi:long-chain fatty acid transport protein